MQMLAYPMRLQPNGILRRDSAGGSLIALLQAMARTPAGSWNACPKFGLRDIFEDSRLRADAPQLAMVRVNDAFAELGLQQYRVTEVVRELSPQRETDTYAITVEDMGAAESLTTRVVYQP